MIEIYTDGALATSTKQGGYCFIILKNDNIIVKEYNGMLGTTNNRMELLALIDSFYWIIKQKPIIDDDGITIYSDSMYVIGIARDGNNINQNKDLWDIYGQVLLQLPNCKTEFKHVKGHGSNKFNNKCDTWAVMASNLDGVLTEKEFLNKYNGLYS